MAVIVHSSRVEEIESRRGQRRVNHEYNWSDCEATCMIVGKAAVQIQYWTSNTYPVTQ